MRDFVGMTPLQCASSKGLFDIMQLLLDYGSAHPSTL